MTVTPPGRTDTVLLGLLAAFGGGVVAGLVGSVVGLFAGVAATRRPRVVLGASAVALVATAAFTVLEQPLIEANISMFAREHTYAELAGRVAATLLLAGLVGLAVSQHSNRPPSPAKLSNPPSTVSRATPGVPTSTIAALVAAALLGAFTLSQVGDRRWEAVAPAIAIMVIGLAVVFAVVDRFRSRIPLQLAPMPVAAAMFTGLRREHAHMLGGSIWLLAATVMVSLGSFVFWLLVTQQVPADDLGRAAALFSATLFVCYLTSLGLPIAVSRYASNRSQGAATLFAWSLVLTIASSLVGVAAFAALAPDSIRDGLAAWHPGFAWLVVFLLVAGMSISVLVDIRLMALRRWSLVFLRSLLIALLRLPFLLWVPSNGADPYVYLVAAGGFAVTGVAFLLPLARHHGLRLQPLPDSARRAARFAGVNYLGQLAVQAPFFAVPFVVLVQVSAVENARFYLSWGVMSVVYVSVTMIGQALLVEGGREGADHRSQASVALGAGLAVATSATLLSLGIGPLLAALYGASYAPVATLLPLLVAGTVPFAVTMTLLTTARIREHSKSTIAVTVVFAVAVLAPTVILTAGHGALGAAWGWTMGNAIAAGLALLVSRLLARDGGERARPGEATPLLTPIPDWQRAGRRG